MIDFTTLGTETVTSTGGGLLNLKKDDFLNLTKHTPGLDKVFFTASWKDAKNGGSADLDISALMLTENGKLRSSADVIFFNNLSKDGISLDGDSRGGSNDDEDNETITVEFSKLDPKIDRVVAVITIHDAEINKQTFGMVKDSTIRITNAENGTDICEFKLTDDYSTDTAVIAGELVRGDNNEWAFHAIGEGYRADLNGICAKFL